MKKKIYINMTYRNNYNISIIGIDILLRLCYTIDKLTSNI